VVVVVVVVVAATPNYLRQASQNLGKYCTLRGSPRSAAPPTPRRFRRHCRRRPRQPAAMLSDMLGWGVQHQFDAQLKKQSVTLEDSSRICRGAPANGDSPIDGYWSCLCDKPLLRNTGRCLTLLVEAVPVRGHHAPRGLMLRAAPRCLRISPFPSTLPMGTR
jgi:hypothetical protein